MTGGVTFGIGFNQIQKRNIHTAVKVNKMNTRHKNFRDEVILFKDSLTIKEPIKLERTREPLVMIKRTSQTPSNTLPATEATPVLFYAKGKRPFDFIPDELIIEEKRIIVKRHFFPFVTTLTTVPMNKLTNFEVTHSFMYSSVHIKANLIADMVFSWLDKNDAQEAKEIIDGLRLRDNESIVVLEHGKNRFIQTLQLMGQV